jgi:hypothetical protein
MSRENTYGQELINRLERDSIWFKRLLPQQKLFVAEYCLNGFDGKLASEKVGTVSNPAILLGREPVMEAVKEFVNAVLVDRASKLEAKITDVLWKRAFYNPLDFIDERGQPRTADGSPFDPMTFDVAEYKRRLGEWAVCIDGIVTSMHPRNADNISVSVKLANRDSALKALSSYVGMARDESAPTSFVVNVNVHDEEQPKKDFKIVPYEKVR